MFRAPAMLLPHESTVAHEQHFIMEMNKEYSMVTPQSSIETRDKKPLERSQSQIPHVHPATPQSVSHTHDEDFSDDDSEEKLSRSENNNLPTTNSLHNSENKVKVDSPAQ
ncbi:unnamed protein product [Diabrotica balteata]|uniref:Uncharacterized protein n=1 Tax=Diabrotica balteata TaxID=107213 RepID=A0A9N9TDK4_DIABA|nr:unnamed protein product [Diabrotica balteata]